MDWLWLFSSPTLGFPGEACLGTTTLGVPGDGSLPSSLFVACVAAREKPRTSHAMLGYGPYEQGVLFWTTSSVPAVTYLLRLSGGTPPRDPFLCSYMGLLLLGVLKCGSTTHYASILPRVAYQYGILMVFTGFYRAFIGNLLCTLLPLL